MGVGHQRSLALPTRAAHPHLLHKILATAFPLICIDFHHVPLTLEVEPSQLHANTGRQLDLNLPNASLIKLGVTATNTDCTKPRGNQRVVVGSE